MRLGSEMETELSAKKWNRYSHATEKGKKKKHKKKIIMKQSHKI